MNVRKVTYTKKEHTCESEKFYAVFADHAGIIRRLPLFESKKASESAAKKVQELVDLRAANATLSPDLSRWVESMPNEVRERLAKYGVLAPATVAAGKPLSEHLDDCKAALLARGSGEDYVNLVIGRAKKVLSDCGFTFWSEISGSKLQGQIAEMRKDRVVQDATERGISAQTANFYLQAAKQFCRWMVREGRASASPIAHLQGLNVKTDRRHDRRAFTLDELLWMLKTTSKGPVRAKMAGSERVLLYRLAVETGLRRGGLARLTRESFDLDGDDPSVLVKAGAKNKYKNERRIPLKADTAALLGPHVTNKMPAVPTFDVPPKEHSAKMVRADLADAREAWLKESQTTTERAEREKSDFLLYENHAGQFLDFHALRHTRGVWLIEHHKAHPREVQELMGVSSLALVDRYTRSFRLTDLSVIERGPDLTLPPESTSAKATGTDGPVLPNGEPAGLSLSLSPGLSPKGGFERISMESGGVTAGSPGAIACQPDSGKSSGKHAFLTSSNRSATVESSRRRGGRAVECAGFENRYG